MCSNCNINCTIFKAFNNCSFFCCFLLPALSASYLRSAPSGIAAATERPFMVVQALSPDDAQGIMHSLTSSRVRTLHPSRADFYIGSLLLRIKNLRICKINYTFLLKQ
jgi:hypothetical protein